MNRTARWIPVVAVPAVVVAGAIALPTVANADPTLPTKTARQVLAMVADAKDAAFSGTVEQTSDLGLPELPTASGSAGSASSVAGVLDLLGSTHRIRVYADGASKQRVQVLDSLAERDVIRNGTTLWTWDSKTRKATKTTLPTASDAARSDTAVTPSALAQKLLDAVRSSTTVTVSNTARVAGRDAYQLRLTPKSGDTLVKDAVLSVDAKTGLPLRVQVDATGQKTAAVTVGYTSIDVSAPDGKLFDFTAPSGATVTTKDLSQTTRPDSNGTDSGGPVSLDADAHRPTTVGSGWATIAVLPAGSTSAKSGSADAQKLFGELTRQVAGGRAIQTSLVSVFFADDGRLLVGAVPVSALQAAAG